jgi:hypothetical protein
MFEAMQKKLPAPIVVIEDHAEYLDYLVALLERAGYVPVPFTAAAMATRYIVVREERARRLI